jgi:proton glutamate symport protein
VPVKKFWRHVREPWLIAFLDGLGEAAFPMAMQNMEKMGVPKHIVSLRAAHRATPSNLDGSTLYLAVASIFVAQAAGRGHAVRARQLVMSADADAHVQGRGGGAAGPRS